MTSQITPKSSSSSFDSEPGWGIAFVAVAVITLWRIVELMAAPTNLSFDEAQYWSWSLTPAFGYFSKPPIVAWVIAATTSVFGHAEWAIRMGSPLAHGGTALALFALGRQLFNGRVGLFSALVFATVPGVSLSAYLISTDPFLMCAWGWGLVVFHRALQREANGASAFALWSVLGLIIGIGMLAKYAMIAFVASAILTMAFAPDWRGYWRRPGPWIALILGGVVFSPNVFWNAANHYVSFAHTKANANLAHSGLHPLKALEFFGSQFGVFGPILFAVLIGLAVTLRKRLREAAGEGQQTLIFLACFTLPLIVVMTVEGFISRANANWAAPAYVAGTVWVVSALMTQQVWIKASLGLHLVIALALVNFDSLVQITGVTLTAKTDPMKRLRGWDRMGRALSDVVAHSLEEGEKPLLVFDERKVLTPMLYYMPKPHPAFAKWNPDGHVDDHYDLTMDLKNYVGRDVILVTRWPDPAAFTGSFTGDVSFAPIKISVPIHSNYNLTLQVVHLGRFKGYGPQ